MGEVICKANASELGKLGAKTRWQAYHARKLALQMALDNPGSIPSHPEIQPANDKFAEESLTRVQRHVRKLQGLIDAELDGDCDAPRLKQLSDALSRLAEIERQLAGRPLPGSLRPKAEKPKRIANPSNEPDEV